MTAANEDILLSYGGVLTKLDGDLTVFSFRQWSFKSHHDKILDSSGLIKLAKEITLKLNDNCEAEWDDEEDRIKVNGFQLHVPPMTFGNDVFSLTYSDSQMTIANTTTISFNSRDSILTWAAQHTESHISRYPLTIIQVPHATIWAEKFRVQDIETSVKDGSQGNVSADVDEIGSMRSDLKSWDWTFSADYCCTIIEDIENEPQECSQVVNIISSRELNIQQTDNWHCRSSSGIDTEMLRATDQPILFYDETILYQVNHSIPKFYSNHSFFFLL